MEQAPPGRIDRCRDRRAGRRFGRGTEPCCSGRLLRAGDQHRIPTFGNYPYYADNGLLFAYGGGADPLNERAADYVDKILRGARPGDLPITLPVKFNLEVNLKTAKALGLVIPESFLLAADKVIK